ncbi:hypothetical protein A2U01_0063899, partial [Trifolium medium]|nr:hypothetical protein [Trifolium medium]
MVSTSENNASSNSKEEFKFNDLADILWKMILALGAVWVIISWTPAE